VCAKRVRERDLIVQAPPGIVLGLLVVLDARGAVEAAVQQTGLDVHERGRVANQSS